MVLIYSPQWFYGIDAVLDFVTVLTCIFIGYFSIRSHNITGQKKYLYFGIAFYAISIGYIVKNLTFLSIYFKLFSPYTQYITKVFVEVRIIYLIGLFFYKFLTLSGFLALFLFAHRTRENVVYMMFYTVFLFSMISNQLFYHLLALGLLAYVLDYYHKNYQKHKKKGAGMVRNAFILIVASQAMFIFQALHPLFYVAAEFMLMAGFITLLYMFLKVVR